jgi:hypothetical protein
MHQSEIERFTVLIWSDDGIVVQHIKGDGDDAEIAALELAGDEPDWAVLPGWITPEIVTHGGVPLEEAS